MAKQSINSFMKSRNSAEYKKPPTVGPTLKQLAPGKLTPPVVKPLPEVSQHIMGAQDHIAAANMVKEHDHESAADHLAKAATHAQAAAQHFKTHSDKWIQKAQLKKGAFTAKAKAAGKSIGGEIASVLKPGSNASAKTKKQAVLAKTFRKMARG